MAKWSILSGSSTCQWPTNQLVIGALKDFICNFKCRSKSYRSLGGSKEHQTVHNSRACKSHRRIWQALSYWFRWIWPSVFWLPWGWDTYCYKKSFSLKLTRSHWVSEWTFPAQSFASPTSCATRGILWWQWAAGISFLPTPDGFEILLLLCACLCKMVGCKLC